MAGRKSGGVIDWAWLIQEMPIANDAFSKRARHLLFDRMDVNGNGIIAKREVIMGFIKSIGNVRGIIDPKPIWVLCYAVARAAVDPVLPIGTDFMERNQFRLYMVCVWIYMRLWEYFYCSCPRVKHEVLHVTVKLHDLPAVSRILEDFGYQDAQRFEVFVRPYLQNVGAEVSFEKFAELCLKHVLPELSDIEAVVEKKHAIAEIGKLHPGLLSKAEEVGTYEAHSMESGQARMTGFVFKKKMQKSLSDSSVMRSLGPEVKPKGNPVAPAWTSQYSMQFTHTKFFDKAMADPLNHPSHTERDLVFSHPYFHVSNLSPGFKPSGSGINNSVPMQRTDIRKLDVLGHPGFRRVEASKPLQTAGMTMAQKLQRLGVIQGRS